MNNLKQVLYAALVTQFKVDKLHLADDTGLFSGGLLDSLSVMDLVCLVETTIGTAIPPADITIENFDSIAQIVSYTRALTGEPKDQAS